MTKMYEAINHIFIYTGYAEPIEHCHMAAHIMVAVDGDLKVSAGGSEQRVRGILIPSGVSHMVDTGGKTVLVFLYDSTTNVAREIRAVQGLSEEICERIVTLYSEFEKGNDVSTYAQFEKRVLEQIGITESKGLITDSRIMTAMDYIRTHLSEKITCQEVADFVSLSQGRLSHLFREQVGMSFAAYLVYQRILYVYTQILQGRSITEAAIEAGFSSSGHFADVNRRVFGLAARNITKDLAFIKVQ